MYILVNKNTNKVFQVSENKPISYSDNLILCEVDWIPLSYDYLIAENVHEETETLEEIVEDYDDNGEIVTRTEEMTRTYFTCDLVAKFRPQPTDEQIEKAKEKRYGKLVARLVRQKYSQDDVEALLANYTENSEKYQDEFTTFTKYRQECKDKARKQIYGGN